MTMLTQPAGGPILTPEEVGQLVVRPTLSMSVAADCSTVTSTASSSYRIPVVTKDPTAAWVAEGQEINQSEATLDEVTITPAKVAGLTIISRELANDTNPAAAGVVGEGLARDIARKVDEAYFGKLAAPAPAGLDSINPTVAVGGGSWANLDLFAAALSNAENHNTVVNRFVANPATVLALSVIKKQTGSVEMLLAPDPSVPGKRTILGVPLLSSPAVAPDVVWAIPQNRAHLVLREGARIEVDSSVFFTSDRVAVKATMRVGFGFSDPAAVTKLTKGA
ncbi:phage major capsid protein [Enemella evansiae]|nr:phage major capsid protein [Enemella evansiae]